VLALGVGTWNWLALGVGSWRWHLELAAWCWHLVLALGVGTPLDRCIYTYDTDGCADTWEVWHSVLKKKTSGDGCDGTWQVRHSVFKLLETGVMARGRCVTASLTSILTDVLAGTASLKKKLLRN